MRMFDSTCTPPRSVTPSLSFAPAACLLALLLFAAGAHAQVRPPLPRQPSEESASAMRQAKPVSAPAPSPDEDEESESGDELRTRPVVTDPAAVMRKARVVYVRSLTAFVSEREVEDSLRKRKEFGAWGMAITRDEGAADIIVEITRKSLSRRFTFTVVEPRTLAVVTSGKTRSVLFGKKIPNKIAEKFANRFRAVRPYPASP
jgi:hypothetical protein